MSKLSENLENLKPNPSKDYKKWQIYAVIFTFIFAFTFAFISILIKLDTPPTTNSEEIKAVEPTFEENNPTEITYTEFFKESVPQDINSLNNSTDFNNNSNNNIISNLQDIESSNQKNNENDFLQDYLERRFQLEEMARNSSISFTLNSNTSANNEDNNFQNLDSTNPLGNIEFPKQPSTYREQNMQSDKLDFLKSDKGSFYNPFALSNPISQYELMAGNFIPATLITGINSDLPSNTVAVVREDVYDTITGNFLLIPKGTRIIGTYDSGVAYGQTRVLIIWQRLIFPNGKYIGLDNMGGIDLSGYAGFTGKVNNHFGKLLQAVILSSALGAGTAIVTQNSDPTGIAAEAGKGAGEQILEIGANIARRVLDVQPTIEIKQGYRFNILVQSNLVLEPYKEK